MNYSNLLLLLLLQAPIYIPVDPCGEGDVSRWEGFVVFVIFLLVLWLGATVFHVVVETSDGDRPGYSVRKAIIAQWKWVKDKLW